MKTISFHNGTSWSRGHNIRDERYTDKQEHIDKSLSEQNIIVRDVPIRQAYSEIFGQAVKEYNAKQKRTDRCIDNYYNKIKQDKRKYPVYECIVQIGDKSDTGIFAELEKQALIKFSEEWDKRNPNLRLIGAYIHADEPNGTVHAHIDYIPVAECTRGMRLQNSLDRALQQQGFETKNIHQTAQIAWQDSEREALCVICKELNIDAQRNQGIGEGREYLSPKEYKLAKAKQQEQIETDLQPLKAELDEYLELKTNADSFLVEEKKLPFVKKVAVSIDDIKLLKDQAYAYRANRFEVDTLRERKKALDEKELELSTLKNRVEERRQEVEKNNDKVLKMYSRQKSLNQILETTEEKLKKEEEKNGNLINENASLKESNVNKAKTIQQLTEANRKAYESLTSICQALNMLRHDKNKGYMANLTPQQARLVDGVINYGAYLTKKNGYPELSKSLKDKMGIIEGIRLEMKKVLQQQQEKIRNNSIGRMSR
jgi:hypothetical protein